MRKTFLSVVLLVAIGPAAGVWGQDNAPYVERKWSGFTRTPDGRVGMVISEDYYEPVYIDPVIRYRYPAWQALGDGVHYKRVGQPGWRFVKVGHQLYIFGPGFYYGNWNPFAYGPGDMVVGARGCGYAGIPIAASLFTFFMDLAIRF